MNTKLGPVETAVRRTVSPGAVLQTPMRPRPFVVGSVDASGITLLLGAKQAATPISWACFEGVQSHLRGRGWVISGGVHSKNSKPGSLDEYMKKCIYRDTANYVAALLEQAGVLELRRTAPLHVRLMPGF